MRSVPGLPGSIAGIAVPRDDVSEATWRWANRRLPEYLLTHSVRAYCWGAAIADGEGWTFDRQILWNAALLHDVGHEDRGALGCEPLRHHPSDARARAGDDDGTFGETHRLHPRIAR